MPKPAPPTRAPSQAQQHKDEERAQPDPRRPPSPQPQEGSGVSNVTAGADGASPAVMAMGMLAERLEADQLVAREAFAGRFAAFASREQRKLVKDTFA